MKRKLTRNSPLSSVALCIAVLTLLIAVAVLAQVTGAGRPSGKASAGSAPPGVAAPAQAERPSTPRTDGAGRFPEDRSQAKRHRVVPMDSNPPLFLPVVTYDSGGNWADSVAVADLNGDGKPDLGVSNRDSVGVLLGNGDGTFQPVVTYGSGGADPQSVAVADVNGDGKPDLVVANAGSNNIGILLGNGDGTFQLAVIYDSGGYSPFSVAVADLNGDGKFDVVVANYAHLSGTGVGLIGVLLGNGDGTFQAVVGFDTGGYGGLSVNVADVNSDGRLDLLVANQKSLTNSSGSVSVLLGNGDGTFQAAATYGSGGRFSYSIGAMDVNGDGRPDLVVSNLCATSDRDCTGLTNGVLGVLLGNGDGTFQAAATYDSGGVYAISIAAADINGDGKPDLLAANVNSSNIGVLVGNGDGTFQAAVTYGSGGHGPFSVAVADLNGDGSPDALTGNFSPGSVGVLLHNGTPITLVSSLNPAALHKMVTYTASATSQNGGAVTGTVTFQDGGSAIATIPLTNNQAAYSTRYTKGGSHAITATYSGDAHNTGSISGTLIEYIEGVASKIVVTTSGSPSFVGQPVTFTATVTSTHGTIPDGELVTFYDGKSTLGSTTLAGGTATFTTSALSGKTHTIQAKYSGDTTFEPSIGVVTQIVNHYCPAKG